MPSQRAAAPRTADISVVIATRGRPRDAIRAVRSLLTTPIPALSVIVVDQSDVAQRAEIVQALENDSRVRVVAAGPDGLAAARNIGVLSTRSSIVAFTDDDCEVGPDWVDQVAAAFASDARIGVVLGSVTAGPHDRTAGCIPSYDVPRPLLITSIAQKARSEGLGACMAIRRTTWEAVGGFDELLGAGSALKAGEDGDFVMRALQAGHWVFETPDVSVTHLGFRRWPEMARLIDGYMLGFGAAHAKLLRGFRLRALQPILGLAWQWLLGRSAMNLGPRPSRLIRLSAFARGVRVGLSLPIDPLTGRFRRIDERRAPSSLPSFPLSTATARPQGDKLD